MASMQVAARADVIAFIRGLSDEDLAVLFYEAMQTRNEIRRFPEGEYWNDVYVIGIASHSSGAPATVDVLATALVPGQFGTGDIVPDGPVHSGICDLCQTSLYSTATCARCPVCQGRVQCN